MKEKADSSNNSKNTYQYDYINYMLDKRKDENGDEQVIIKFIFLKQKKKGEDEIVKFNVNFIKNGSLLDSPYF